MEVVGMQANHPKGAAAELRVALMMCSEIHGHIHVYAIHRITAPKLLAANHYTLMFNFDGLRIGYFSTRDDVITIPSSSSQRAYRLLSTCSRRVLYQILQTSSAAAARPESSMLEDV